MYSTTNRQLFFQHLAQTSDKPIGIEVASAKGVMIQDVQGKSFMDLIAGFSVCNIGHSHPDVIKAIQDQVAQYMHVIVYGEFIQSPQVQYAKALTHLLPSSLQSVYFTNSGAEATEGAMKLAKRVTKRSKIIAFEGACNSCRKGKFGYTFVGNVSNNYISMIFDIKEDKIMDLYDCRYFKNKIGDLVLNKKLFISLTTL